MSKTGAKNAKAARVAERADALVAQALDRAERIARGETEAAPPRRANKKGRTPAQKAADQYVAVQLSVQGYNHDEIATAIGISPAQVANDLRVVNTIFRKRAAEAVDEHRGRHLAMTDAAIGEMWRAWRSSKGEVVTVTTEGRRGGADGTGALTGKVVTKKEVRTGDVNYMFAMAKMMERTAKLAGLDKPVEAKVYVEQAQDTIDRVANALVEELHGENPELVERLLGRIAALEETQTAAPDVEAEADAVAVVVRKAKG